MRRVLTLLLLLCAVGLLPAAPAAAAARVTVTNDDGGAAVDPTYTTTLTVRGTGFQTIKGGHGGIYVFFGTVSDGWQPSQGGQTGQDYFYVPDSESSDNQGFQRYLAFPGSDTASSASGTMRADGSWSTTINVPGAVFQAVDRAGNARSIDCRKVTCGVITVGAHGVVNNRNESFAPVRVESLYDESAAPSAAPSTPAVEPSAAATETRAPVDEPTGSGKGKGNGKGKGKPAAVVAASLEVDRASAHPGNVLAFTAAGLTPGAQVSAVLDDGAAGAGPFLVGQDGRLAGVVTIPADTVAGTHELRLFGVEKPPTVSFAVTEAVADPATPPTTPVAATTEDADRAGLLFAAGSAAVLVLALVRLLAVRRRRVRA